MTWAGGTSVALVVIAVGLVAYLLVALLDPERF
ncbi:K(+)-transporting ATPase subunit F [Rhodococcus sp. HM1]|nr:K(+)-transporting ATPase subunit F [Rhodococcus sp. HM1]MCK8672279.1 K(+)-transporting ATPase subunit F [Rhodococcus sp. HM1]